MPHAFLPYHTLKGHHMWIVTTLALLCGGLLGAANLIVTRKPNAKELIDKLVPYQGAIGVVMFLCGLWCLISLLRTISAISYAPLWWLLLLVVTATQLGLGFLLGYGFISRYALSKSAQAMEKGEKLRVRLAAYQGALGVTAIILAGLSILMKLMAE
ncbi:MAG TPA: hypothetical protein VMV94_10765, partial [Phycisphaerae bacterium]|nr:hypothetical protein [Phycisphaerae bacterium]